MHRSEYEAAQGRLNMQTDRLAKLGLEGTDLDRIEEELAKIGETVSALRKMRAAKVVTLAATWRD